MGPIHSPSRQRGSRRELDSQIGSKNGKIEYTRLMTHTGFATKYTTAAATPTRPTLRGSFGMSASTHWLATASAQSVLERGGNAFDAAVAAGFVLHVVEPHLNGPAGDMVALYAPRGRDPRVLMGQGPAPARATIQHFTAEGLDSVPGAGALAAAVPAAVEAWMTLLADHGTWELAEVLEYAIHYAENGHPLGHQAAAVIGTMAVHFEQHWPTSASLWIPDQKLPAAGDNVKNVAYANVLKRLVEAGSAANTRQGRIRESLKEWKEGFVAQALTTFARRPHRHSSGTDHAGVIGLSDFSDFNVCSEEPVSMDFRGTTVVKAGFWSQGPVLLQCLAILKNFDDEHLDPSTALGAHTIIEALKLAMADRDSFYGDSRAEPADLTALYSDAYGRDRAQLISDYASKDFRPGALPGIPAHRPPLVNALDSTSALGAGEPTVRITGETRGDTCHLDVVDRYGNMVSATPSGGWLQSSPAIPELGFALGTRLQMTWLDESSPSALRPGARPRTTLSPTLLMRDGRVVASLGSPGGDQQDQWQLLYLLRTLVGGYAPQEAIDAPTFHTSALASSFWPRTWNALGVIAESRLQPEVLAELRERGHDVTVVDAWSLGRLSTVLRDPGTGQVSAAANPRGNQGYAAGR
ncbi:Gamma-glutamyltranspeptidase [Arthrobacter sp. 9V]|nr:Gamma-glutamyltranspeptidase [Arthrobacter sp. 9V]